MSGGNVTMLIVGSTAMQYLREKRGYHTLPRREPSDFDVWTIESDQTAIPMYGSTDLSMMPEHILELVERDAEDYRYPSLNSLFTIKISHLGWDIMWQKHKRDAIIMKYAGAQVIPELYDALVEQWKHEHGNKDFLSLNQSKKDFFTDSVEYVLDHDYLHELAAYPNQPMYKEVLQENQDVMIDKEKFFSLPFEKQVKMFREEITVIACERWLINPNTSGKVRWTKAWQYALRKTCTTLTKNWATDFLVKNIDHFDRACYADFEHIVNELGLETEGSMSEKIEMSVIEEICNELSCDLYDLVDGHFYGDTNNTIDENRKCFEFIKQEGGGEGGAEDCYSVFKYKDVYYKIFYNYYSHHGFEFDYATAFIVTPAKKEITVYE